MFERAVAGAQRPTSLGPLGRTRARARARSIDRRRKSIAQIIGDGKIDDATGVPFRSPIIGLTGRRCAITIVGALTWQRPATRSFSSLHRPWMNFQSHVRARIHARATNRFSFSAGRAPRRVAPGINSRLTFAAHSGCDREGNRTQGVGGGRVRLDILFTGKTVILCNRWECRAVHIRARKHKRTRARVHTYARKHRLLEGTLGDDREGQ